jgi:hypothetical protein
MDLALPEKQSQSGTNLPMCLPAGKVLTALLRFPDGICGHNTILLSVWPVNIASPPPTTVGRRGGSCGVSFYADVPTGPQFTSAGGY